MSKQKFDKRQLNFYVNNLSIKCIIYKSDIIAYVYFSTILIKIKKLQKNVNNQKYHILLQCCILLSNSDESMSLLSAAVILS